MFLRTYGLTEELQYAEMLSLCKYCRCLFWRSLGHPCIADQSPEFRERVQKAGGPMPPSPVPPSAFLKFFSLWNVLGLQWKEVHLYITCIKVELYSKIGWSLGQLLIFQDNTEYPDREESSMNIYEYGIFSSKSCNVWNNHHFGMINWESVNIPMGKLTE